MFGSGDGNNVLPGSFVFHLSRPPLSLTFVILLISLSLSFLFRHSVFISAAGAFQSIGVHNTQYIPSASNMYSVQTPSPALSSSSVLYKSRFQTFPISSACRSLKGRALPPSIRTEKPIPEKAWAGVNRPSRGSSAVPRSAASSESRPPSFLPDWRGPADSAAWR